MNRPKSISLDYHTPLESKLKDLSLNKDHDNMQGKKYFLLDMAFVHFRNMMVSPATEVLTLPDLLPYEYAA
jgi:hypothetical protein